MCIIVYRPPGTAPLDKEIWKECFRMHSDGAGFAFFDDKKNLVVDKGFMKFDELYKAIEKYESFESMTHFRTASPGMVVDEFNTHPFKFTGVAFKTEAGKARYKWALTHNGKMPYGHTNKRSDTHCFVDENISKVLNNWPYMLDDTPGVELLTGFVGASNKLVIMRKDEETGDCDTYFINRSAGTEAHGCWFSNESFRLPKHQWHGGMGGKDFLGLTGGATGYGANLSKEDLEVCIYNATTQDAHGWCWSVKHDCWLNFAKKSYTQYLPWRRQPYVPSNTSPFPTGWKFESVVAVPPPPDVITPPPPVASEDKTAKDKNDVVVNFPVDGETEGVPDLEHLEPDEVGVLCRTARAFLKKAHAMKDEEIRKMTGAEMIDWLRDGVKSFRPDVYKDFDEMTYLDLDLIMLALIKDGKFHWEEWVMKAQLSGAS